MWRAICLAVLCMTLLTLGPGCSKRVLVEGQQIQARHAAVVTFSDGSQIRGKIGLDETVEVTTGGTVYRGLVVDLTDEELVVEQCRFISRLGDYQAARERMMAARSDLGNDPARFVFRRADITSVERLQVDAMSTATRTVFWTLGGAVVALLLSEKS